MATFVNEDAELTTLVARLRAHQRLYFSSNAKYWQGLASHLSQPTGSERDADNLDSNPTDQVEKWPYAKLKTLCSYEVHTYHGPDGKGWVLLATAKGSDGLYKKASSVGPETWRSFDWQKDDDGL